jgi:DcmR-like sensory protein
LERTVTRTQIVAGPGHFHAVRFYKDAAGLSRIVADFLAEGLAVDQPAVVIATPKHREAIRTALAERSFDVATLEKDAKLYLIDAQAMLDEFMVDDMPDAERFQNAITPIMERACGGWKECVVRAYGEMVDVLWKGGHTVAATKLETLWNMLANTNRFSLLCGYAMGNFYKEAAVDEICSHHSHVVSSSGEVTAMN